MQIEQHYCPAVCIQGMVRLEGGVTSMQGVVSLCIGNKWRQVCDTYWTAADTKVVCGQLGYTGKMIVVLTPLSLSHYFVIRWSGIIRI